MDWQPFNKMLLPLKQYDGLRIYKLKRTKTMKSWQKKHPPYLGAEPYVYFAFADEDAGRVWPLLCRLLCRGCRVWYAAGRASGAQALLERQRRAAGAALSLVWLTDAARADADLKSALLANQSAGRPILCLDADRGDGGLSMGLYESTPHLPAHRGVSPAELETLVIRAPGFRQELLGAPQTIRDPGWMGRLVPVLLVLAALLLAGAFLRMHRAEPEDSLVISDTVLRGAVRAAIGGGAITAENAAQIRSLRLDRLPASWKELELLTSLERIELPQTLALEGPLPEGDWTIVLREG